MFKNDSVSEKNTNLGLPKTKLTVFDVILIAVLLIIALLYPILSAAFLRESDSMYVEITDTGENIVYEYPLDIDKNIEIECGGHNYTVKIENGKASVAKSDCENQICVKTPPISKSGSSIVCAAGRLIVEIKSDFEEKNYADFVIQ